ncbi:MAG: ATP-binding protein [Lachnospiraceae bacterium]|nr:ATP-binding protein [Lachnospiraceae bacterium]
MIRKFANSPGTSAMLITGAPGMGKSSLVSWIAHTYQRDDQFILLRFRDWESEELAQGLLKAICRTLAYNFSESQ